MLVASPTRPLQYLELGAAVCNALHAVVVIPIRVSTQLLSHLVVSSLCQFTQVFDDGVRNLSQDDEELELLLLNLQIVRKVEDELSGRLVDILNETNALTSNSATGRTAQKRADCNRNIELQTKELHHAGAQSTAHPPVLKVQLESHNSVVSSSPFRLLQVLERVSPCRWQLRYLSESLSHSQALSLSLFLSSSV